MGQLVDKFEKITLGSMLALVSVSGVCAGIDYPVTDYIGPISSSLSFGLGTVLMVRMEHRMRYGSSKEATLNNPTSQKS